MVENSYTKWSALAEANGWRVERSGQHVKWYPPDGGTIVVTASPIHTPPAYALRNDRSRLIRAGLPIREAEGQAPKPEPKPEPEEHEEEPVAMPDVTNAETAAALDAFMELVTEEIASLRRDLTDAREAHERLAKSHAALLREIQADIRGLKARPDGPTAANFVTKTALERALLVQAESIEAKLKAAVDEAAANHDPLGYFRAKMRGEA